MKCPHCAVAMDVVHIRRGRKLLRADYSCACGLEGSWTRYSGWRTAYDPYDDAAQLYLEASTGDEVIEACLEDDTDHPAYVFQSHERWVSHRSKCRFLPLQRYSTQEREHHVH